MATQANMEQIKIGVCHLLAETGKSLTVKEMSEAIQVKIPLVTRACFQAKRDTPKMIDIDPESGGSRYTFVGEPEFLDPLPETIEIDVSKIAGKKSSKKESAKGDQSKAATPPKSKEGQEKASKNAKKVKELSESENQVLSHLQGKGKEATSGIYEELEHVASINDVNEALNSLESKGLVRRHNIEDFDEDVVEATSKGKNLSVSPAPKAKGPKASSKAEKKPSSEAKSAQKTTKGQPGRPSGPRDYNKLRAAILEYVQKNPGVTKTEAGKSLSTTLENFGRMTISKEFVSLCNEGSLIPYRTSDGNEVSGRFMTPTASQNEKEIVSEKPKEEKQAPPVPSEEEPTSGGYDTSTIPSKTSEESHGTDFEGLKAKIEAASEGGDDYLSENVSELLSQVGEYVRSLEQSNRKLRNLLTRTLEEL